MHTNLTVLRTNKELNNNDIFILQSIQTFFHKKFDQYILFCLKCWVRREVMKESSMKVSGFID